MSGKNPDRTSRRERRIRRRAVLRWCRKHRNKYRMDVIFQSASTGFYTGDWFTRM
jgi:hypothetical protein